MHEICNYAESANNYDPNLSLFRLNYYSKKKPFPPFQAEQFFGALPSRAKFLGFLILLDRFHSILNTKRDLREKIAEKKENKEKLRSTKCTRKLTSAAAAAAKITA